MLFFLLRLVASIVLLVPQAYYLWRASLYWTRQIYLKAKLYQYFEERRWARRERL